MKNLKYLLIIATSGRMLAQLSQQSGYTSIVIDCFADMDTQSMALDYVKVDSLALNDLQPAIAALKNEYDLSLLIYGSGFECHSESLAYLHKNFTVLGNSSNTFNRVINKPCFFSSLSNMHITYPTTLFSPPIKKMASWLFKPLYGEGGRGIKHYHHHHVANPSLGYWQKQIMGDSLSVLFLANKVNFKIIGFHRQYVAHDFIFSNIITYPAVDKTVQQTLTSWLALLVTAFKLNGLNSLDFIVKNNQCYVLEINPRLSASVQLYDGLLSTHIDCCLSGQLIKPTISPAYHAYFVFYAQTDLTIPAKICWPPWVVDIPHSNTLIYTQAPICSIIASGQSEQQVTDLLHLRYHQLTHLLYR